MQNVDMAGKSRTIFSIQNEFSLDRSDFPIVGAKAGPDWNYIEPFRFSYCWFMRR